eukprot:239958-Rhodomonas_salina.1
MQKKIKRPHISKLTAYQHPNSMQQEQHATDHAALLPLDMDQGDQVQGIYVEEIGLCIAAVDFVSITCDKNRRDAHNTVNGILKSKNASEAAEILCRKHE